jgi:hypothetical protein
LPVPALAMDGQYYVGVLPKAESGLRVEGLLGSALLSGRRLIGERGLWRALAVERRREGLIWMVLAFAGLMLLILSFLQ